MSTGVQKIDMIYLFTSANMVDKGTEYLNYSYLKVLAFHFWLLLIPLNLPKLKDFPEGFHEKLHILKCKQPAHDKGTLDSADTLLYKALI